MGTACFYETLVTYGTTWFHNWEECCLPSNILSKLLSIKFTWYLIAVFFIILCEWGTKTYQQVKSYFEDELQCSWQLYWCCLIWAWRICCTRSFWLVFCWFIIFTRLCFVLSNMQMWHMQVEVLQCTVLNVTAIPHILFLAVSRIWSFKNRLNDSFSNISL